MPSEAIGIARPISARRSPRPFEPCDRVDHVARANLPHALVAEQLLGGQRVEVAAPLQHAVVGELLDPHVADALHVGRVPRGPVHQPPRRLRRALEVHAPALLARAADLELRPARRAVSRRDDLLLAAVAVLGDRAAGERDHVAAPDDRDGVADAQVALADQPRVVQRDVLDGHAADEDRLDSRPRRRCGRSCRPATRPRAASSCAPRAGT